MDTRKIIYIGIAVAVFGLLIATAWSDRKIAKLEREITNAKATAETIQKAAAVKEIEAAEYKQKVEFLESELDKIQQLSRKQDEKLSTQNTNTRRARADVERVRGASPINGPNGVTREELCRKLNELGVHGCGE